jgi:MFS family permease
VYACVARGYPTDDQPRMLAVLSTAWVVPGLVGPSVAGMVADYASWRFVFAGLLPFLAIAAALTVRPLRALPPPSGAARAASSQIGSACLLATGTVAVLLGIEGRTALPPALLALGLAAALVGGRPLMPRGTLRARKGLPAAVAAMGLVSVAFFGAEALLPLEVTTLRGRSATVAGMMLSGASLAWTSGAWLQAREAKRRGRGALVAAGASFLAAGIAVVGLLLHPGTPIVIGAVGWALAGFGMGLAHATISLTVVEQAAPGEEGAGTAAMQLANVLGVALGAGVGGAAVAAGTIRGWAPQAGFGVALGLTLAAALGTAAVARQLPGPAAAPLGPGPAPR